MRGGQPELKCSMFITGLGTATPPKRYLQTECWEAGQNEKQFHQLKARSRAIVKKVLLGDNGIVSRYLALDSINEVFAATPDILHQRFARHAPALAAQAGARAMEAAGVSRSGCEAGGQRVIF